MSNKVSHEKLNRKEQGERYGEQLHPYADPTRKPWGRCKGKNKQGMNCLSFANLTGYCRNHQDQA